MSSGANQRAVERSAIADLRHEEGFSVVDDRVMGGRSSGRLERGPHGSLVFAGEVSLDEGGGFSSFRGPAQAVQLSRTDRIVLQVRGDGRWYRLTLAHAGLADGVAYQARFPTCSGQWHSIVLSVDEFEAKFRGRPVRNVPTLTGAPLNRVGIVVADRQEGAFRIELGSICRIKAGRDS